MTAPSAILFDVDGTLVDTTFLHTVCWAEAFRQNGRTVTMSRIHHAIGMGGKELLDECLGADRDRAADDAITAARLVLYRSYWGRLSLLPGARELLAECSRRGLAVVLASSASDDELEALTDALDVDDLITASTTSDDADAGKPSPDILAAALERSGVAAQDAVFVGDAVWDGVAAQRAGLRFVGVTCGGTPTEELRRAGAHEVWEDPAHLLADFDRSLLGTV